MTITVNDHPADVNRLDIDNAATELLKSDERKRIKPQLNLGSKLDEFNPPKMSPAVIEGLLRKREIQNIHSATKAGKSWLALNQGIGVATGGLWLDRFQCHKGRVLYIDNELKRATFENRLISVARAKQISLDKLEDRFQYDCLRGNRRLVDVYKMQSYIDEIEHGDFDLVILDAIYRFWPEGTSENDNGAITNIFNWLDSYADQLDAAVVNVHHTSKGPQGDKALTDVGSGAGAMNRAADSLAVIRTHEKDGYHVFETVCRSFAPTEPFSIYWEFPLWHSSALKPAVKTSMTISQQRKSDDDQKQIESILKYFADKGKFTAAAIANAFGMGVPRCTRLCTHAVNAGQLQRVGDKVNRAGNSVPLFQVHKDSNEVST